MKHAPMRMNGQKSWLSHPSIICCVMVIISAVQEALNRRAAKSAAEECPQPPGD
jgi:hypothetical protein